MSDAAKPKKKNPVILFTLAVKAAVDAMKAGAKINRDKLAKEANKATGDRIRPEDAPLLTGIILRARKDVETSRGPKGGTFKK